jgi:hypothetical protein
MVKRNEWSKLARVAKKKLSSLEQLATNTTIQIAPRKASELDTSVGKRKANWVHNTGLAKTYGHAVRKPPTPKQRKADTDDEKKWN